MEAETQSTQRTRKRRWVMIVLTSISTLTALASFAIGCSFLVAVGLNLEGPFRLRLFWFPMPWWLFQAIVATVIGNFSWILVFCIFSISQLRKRKKTSGGQENPIIPWSPARWHIIWYGSVIGLTIVSPLLLHLSPSFVSKGKTELASVAMVSPTAGWAVGNFQGEQPEGAPYGVIWQYHHGTWTQVAQLADDFLNGVTALPNGEAWAVGSDNTILHEQGGNWTLVHRDSLDSTADLNKVAMVSPAEGWAVGYSFDEQNQSEGVIWHWSRGKWVQVPQLTKNFLWDISALPNGEAWAVGHGGTILHEQGGAWSQVTSPTQQTLYTIEMFSPTEGWAAGDQLLLHYHNGIWAPVSLAAFDYPFRITMVTSSEGWAIGTNGYILHYTQGAWQQVYTPTSQYLADITLVPGTSSEGWIVGDGAISDTNTIPTPTILHMQNGTWSVSLP